MTPGSPYLACVDRMDALVDRLVQHIEANPSLRGRTAIVMTADHGGGAPPLSHTVAESPLNFRIPFVVWTGDGAARDLYDLSPMRARPAASERMTATGGSPIRNADAGNCALWLLGLPSIPTSTVGAEQDLLAGWSRPAP
jgi:arylsulfatase A-like enzyme